MDVLVYNSNWMPLQWVSLRKAVRMLFREVAEVHQALPDRMIGVFPIPVSIRLVRFAPVKWQRSRGPAWSRSGVFARDGHRCAYCGVAGSRTVELTIDHVLPRSRGGQNTWANTVTACGPCNQAKGSKTPAEADMALRIQVYAPSWADLAKLAWR